MRRYALALLLICLGAVFATLQLRPDPAVELEAELLRIEPVDALERLNAGEADANPTKNIRLLHARLAATAGNYDTAQRAYHEVIALGGASAEIMDELATMEAVSGELERAVIYKADAYEQAPDSNRRQTLGYWYRLLRDADRERALLSSVSADELTDFERTRLSDLYLSIGDIAAYRDILGDIAESGGKAELPAKRDLLFFHLESGEPDIALDLARNWVKGSSEDADQLGMILTALIGRGAIAQAAKLGRDAIAANSEIGAVPTSAFIKSGHGGLGREMQSYWLAEDRELDLNDWSELNAVAEITGDLKSLQFAIARQLPGDSEPPAESFMQFLRYQGARALLPYRAYMTVETFEKAPLLGAAWYAWHNQPQESFRYLAAAARTPLSDWDRSIWMSIASGLRGTPFYRELLVRTVDDPRLRDMMISALRSPVDFIPEGPAE